MTSSTGKVGNKSASEICNTVDVLSLLSTADWRARLGEVLLIDLARSLAHTKLYCCNVFSEDRINRPNVA